MSSFKSQTHSRENVFVSYERNTFFPLMFVVDQAVSALYASGRAAGTAIVSDDVLTHETTIWDGNLLPLATVRFSVTRRVLTYYLRRILTECDFSFWSEVASDFEHQVITISSERFRVPEALSQPYLLETNEAGNII